MGNGIHISQKGKVRRHKKKAEAGLKLISASYLHDFVISLLVSVDGKKSEKLIDFLPLFQKYVKGDCLKYYAPENFKKFMVKNNNIYWGRNEDVIFSLPALLNTEKKEQDSEEIVYVI